MAGKGRGGKEAEGAKTASARAVAKTAEENNEA